MQLWVGRYAIHKLTLNPFLLHKLSLWKKYKLNSAVLQMDGTKLLKFIIQQAYPSKWSNMFLQVQRYEAGSTIYGPHTLQAYLNQYAYLLEAALSVRNVFLQFWEF